MSETVVLTVWEQGFTDGLCRNESRADEFQGAEHAKYEDGYETGSQEEPLCSVD